MQFSVGLKGLLRKGDEFLFLRGKKRNKVDLPGGRIDKSEALVPLEDILAREIREELGDEVSYTFGRPLFNFRRLFPEQNLNVFLTVYDLEYTGGEIQLSDEHSSFSWLTPSDMDWQGIDILSIEEKRAYEIYFGIKIRD